MGLGPSDSSHEPGKEVESETWVKSRGKPFPLAQGFGSSQNSPSRPAFGRQVYFIPTTLLPPGAEPGEPEDAGHWGAIHLSSVGYPDFITGPRVQMRLL